VVATLAYLAVQLRPSNQIEVNLSDRGLGEVTDFPRVPATWTRAPGNEKWWLKVGPTFSSDFRTYINQMRDSDADQPPVHQALPWFAADANGEQARQCWMIA
jgi:hypothetical protein